MCFHMFIDVCAHACLLVCTFLQYPSTSIEVGIAGFPPPPPPPPPTNIEKLPTHMSQAAILRPPFETQNYFTFFP